MKNSRYNLAKRELIDKNWEIDVCKKLGLKYQVKAKFDNYDWKNDISFCSESNKYKDIQETDADYAPFNIYYGTYSDMDKKQASWYFYWRNKVRHEEYLDTDISYIYLYAYELLNNIGVKNSEESYKLLKKLWLNYFKKDVNLDLNLALWLYGFVIINNIPINPIELHFDGLLNGAYYDENKVLLNFVNNKTFLEMPIKLIFKFSDYNFKKSKAFDDKMAGILKKVIPEILNSVDIYLKKTKEKGIIDLYKDGKLKYPKNNRYKGGKWFQPYNGTSFGCYYSCNADYFEIITPEYPVYKHNEDFRNLITNIIKHTENIYRYIIGFKSTLKNYFLEPEIEQIIDYEVAKYFSEFIDEPVIILKSKQNSKTGSKIPKPEKKLNIELFNRLNVDLDQRRIAQIFQDTTSVQKVLSGVFDYEEFDKVVELKPKQTENTIDIELDINHIEFLKYLLEKEEWQQEELVALSKKIGLLLNGAIDKVNEWTDKNFGDFLIEEDSEKYQLNKEIAVMIQNKEMELI